MRWDFLDDAAPIGQAGLLPYRSGFCSHYDHKRRLTYDPQVFPYLWNKHLEGDAEALDDIVEILKIKRGAGITHIVADLPDGSVYICTDPPDAPVNWTPTQPNWRSREDFPKFLAMVAFLQARGFITDIVYCTNAADVYNGMLKMWCELVRAADLHRRSIHTHAWESSGGFREWSTKQNHDAGLVMRAALGFECLLAVHMDAYAPGRCSIASFLGVHPKGASIPGGRVKSEFIDHEDHNILKEYWIEADDPTNGEEIEAMKHGPFDLVKAQMPIDGAGAFEQAWRDRVYECFERYAPPGTFIPATNSIVRQVTGAPDWMAGAKADGKRCLDRVVYVQFEPAVPFPYSRGRMTDQQVADVSAWLMSIGIENQGCLPAGH